jgi:hypothetical protein
VQVDQVDDDREEREGERDEEEGLEEAHVISRQAICLHNVSKKIRLGCGRQATFADDFFSSL